MSETRANAYLHACLLLAIGGGGALLQPLGPWFGILFLAVGAVHLLIAWRASEDTLAAMQRRRWISDSIGAWRTLRGK